MNRGWHGESERHSLAARGIPSKYLYHGTASNRLRRIREEGLLPTHKHDKVWASSGDYVYLTDDWISARYFAIKEMEKHSRDEEYKKFLFGELHRKPNELEVARKQPMILRVKRKVVEELLKRDPGDPSHDLNLSGPRSYIYPERIPPDQIEVLDTQGNWRSME